MGCWNWAALFAPRYDPHVTGNDVRVLGQSAWSEFSAQSSFMLLQTLVDGATTQRLAGRYYDRFVRAKRALLLWEQQVVSDITMIATDLVYPA